MRNDDDLIGGSEDENALRRLFYKHLPNHRSVYNDGVVDSRKLGPAVGVSYQAVSKWMKRNRVPPARVNALINLEGSTLTRALLLPFVNLG